MILDEIAEMLNRCGTFDIPMEIVKLAKANDVVIMCGGFDQMLFTGAITHLGECGGYHRVYFARSADVLCKPIHGNCLCYSGELNNNVIEALYDRNAADWKLTTNMQHRTFELCAGDMTTQGIVYSIEGMDEDYPLEENAVVNGRH